jgi:uroporphyrinogen-III synthase
VVVATAEGLDRWVAGARRARADVLQLLSGTNVAARGAKATGACRRHGVASVLTSPTERGVDLARLVVGLTEAGEHVAVVADGSGSPRVVEALRSAALAVHVVRPYRWVVPTPAGPTPDPARSVPAAELLRALCAGELDAMAFTSPPAVDGLFAVAASAGIETTVHAALTGGGVRRVTVAAIGPATAEALERRGIGVGMCPLQPRIPALASVLAAAPIARQAYGGADPLLLDHDRRTVTGPGGAVALSHLQFALVASLARRPGLTCPTGVLLREVWGEGASAAAGARRRLEVLASRLRARLAPIDVSLATVPKRGYRLELDRRSVGSGGAAVD